MNQPRVSVLMPVYNVADYLSAAINSVLAQTFSDFEFIIVNDGSTDGTARILQKQRDPRIKLIGQENLGLTASLNNALELARGDYIARMDGDDICFPDRLRQQVDYLERNLEILAVGTQVVCIDRYGALLASEIRPEGWEEIDQQLMMGNGGALVHPSMMVRTDALKAVSGYDEQFSTAQDLDLCLRLSELGPLANLPSYLMMYRIHLSSTNYAKRQRQIRNREEIVRSACMRRKIAYVPLESWDSKPNAHMELAWAWQTLSNGYPGAALRHALKACVANPLSAENWRSIVCSLRGH